jgi:hypothetical protein
VLCLKEFDDELIVGWGNSWPIIVALSGCVWEFFFGLLILVKFESNWLKGNCQLSRPMVLTFYWRINHGDILVECIGQCSLINYSLVTTLGEGSLDCSLATFFFYFFWTSCGFGKSTSVSSFNNGN